MEVGVVRAVDADVDPAFVRALLRRVSRVPEMAARMPQGTTDVAVLITSAEEVRRLNRTFAREDHTTDVLSFPGEGDHIGDIAVSWPAVVKQAKEQGHAARVELAILLVHGFLHLLGWDHRNAAERKEMWRLTDLPLNGHLSGYTPGAGLRRSPRA